LSPAVGRVNAVRNAAFISTLDGTNAKRRKVSLVCVLSQYSRHTILAFVRASNEFSAQQNPRRVAD